MGAGYFSKFPRGTEQWFPSSRVQLVLAGDLFLLLSLLVFIAALVIRTKRIIGCHTLIGGANSPLPSLARRYAHSISHDEEANNNNHNSKRWNGTIWRVPMPNPNRCCWTIAPPLSTCLTESSSELMEASSKRGSSESALSESMPMPKPKLRAHGISACGGIWSYLPPDYRNGTR
eukprot:CAMPEP_0194415818 /NCGR_PEP_ID=MMETSP0176-20130528/14646_1 /TAXON_ID=216777 /ORGANISM="Proboscia alata, Strain PI-D3" /LENGTH=174 /DNA_ID=CAMNT_0039220705 /DNA_START=296 /DNA_END=820 /DNA_ORIENTATION=+